MAISYMPQFCHYIYSIWGVQKIQIYCLQIRKIKLSLLKITNIFLTFNHLNSCQLYTGPHSYLTILLIFLFTQFFIEQENR